jgi:hypothetical protein
VPDGASVQSTGFSFKCCGGYVEIDLSQHTANQVVATWNRTLDWFTQNPYQFTIIALVVAFGLLQCRKARLEKLGMKHEYDARRTNARRAETREPELPLESRRRPNG